MTLVLLIVVAVLLVLYDIFVAYFMGREETISYQSYEISQQYPIIPLVVGILLGHLFWAQHA